MKKKIIGQQDRIFGIVINIADLPIKRRATVRCSRPVAFTTPTIVPTTEHRSPRNAITTTSHLIATLWVASKPQHCLRACLLGVTKSGRGQGFSTFCEGVVTVLGLQQLPLLLLLLLEFELEFCCWLDHVRLLLLILLLLLVMLFELLLEALAFNCLSSVKCLSRVELLFTCLSIVTQGLEQLLFVGVCCSLFQCEFVSAEDGRV